MVAIIGILSMIAVPQFNKVTQNARNSTWEANCQTILSAIAMFQAGNNGAVPSYEDELDDYLNGGFAALNENGGTPDGAKYQFSTTIGSGVNLGNMATSTPAVYFESVYANYTGNNKTYKHGITSVDSQGKFVYKLR